MDKYFFAVDLGATSGRTIIGGIKDGKIELKELTRFPNNLIEVNGHFYWDIYALYFEIIKGLKEAKNNNYNITSIGIDIVNLQVAVGMGINEVGLQIGVFTIALLIGLSGASHNSYRQ